MGKVKNDWQDRDYVLKWFGTKEGEAKRNYRQFVKKGISLGRCPELVGGGFIKFQGGWSAVKAMHSIGIREKSDERILGSGEFVEQLIKQSDQTRKEQFAVYESLQYAVSYVERICDKENISIKALKSGSRRRKITIVRSQLAKELVEEWGLSLTETSRHLGVSPSAIAKTLYRSDKHKSS